VFEPADDWSYTTIVVGVDQPFGLSQNFETDAVDWVELDAVTRRALHPGFASAWPHLRAIVEQADLASADPAG
jgi:8-oxo-dGTP diphosphatase